jgi:26 proteasome complex subunit DSS1
MSASAQGSTATTKAVVDNKTKNGEADKDKKPAAQLEEDDEFEDFPVEGGLILRLARKAAI